MSMAKREFNSTDHLNPEAVAAFVDGELSDSAFRRAARHLTDCDECSAEVDAQRRAANRLRVVDNSGVHAPASLVAGSLPLTSAPTSVRRCSRLWAR